MELIICTLKSAFSIYRDTLLSDTCSKKFQNMIYTYTCSCSSFQVGTVNYSSIFTRWIKVIKLFYVNIKIRDTFFKCTY